MGRGNQASGLFIAADITTIAAAGTKLAGTDFTTLVLETWDMWDQIAVQVYATGASGASGDVTANFLVSLDGEHWETVPSLSAHVTMSGTTPVVETTFISVGGIHSIKLYSIVNGDGSKAAASVNVRWGKSYGF